MFNTAVCNVERLCHEFLMGKDYEEGISLESQKASCQQHSDVTFMYNNKRSVVPPIAIHLATLQMHLTCRSPLCRVATLSQ
jgi:hypothetical protein